LDNIIEHLGLLRDRQPGAHDEPRAIIWRIKLAQGNGKLALAQLLQSSECERAGRRLLSGGETHEQRAVAYVDEAINHFSQVASGVGSQESAAATAGYNLAVARYLKAELVLKASRPETEILVAAAEAEQAFIALDFPNDRQFLRATLAHLYLLEATQKVKHDLHAAVVLASQATDQLRKMSFEQRGYARDWARARKIDTLFAQSEWVAGARTLHDKTG
jgi:hypothetical protein